MGTPRCFGSGDPLYEAYHDEEWGRPVKDSRDEHELFERVSLEAFQAGLSWLTILRKRSALREAFAGFAPAAVAAFTDDDVRRLLLNPAIVRNRLKIQAVIGNASALLAMHAAGERLLGLVLRHAPEPRAAPPATHAEVPTQSPESMALSRDLKARGFRFVGPVTMYALMQAIGVVNDHVQGCWLAR